MGFADDSNDFVIDTDLTQLKGPGKLMISCKLWEWFHTNKLILNLHTLNFSILHPKRKRNTDEFNTLKIGRVIIEMFGQVKCVCTYSDDKTNLKAHINYLCKS